MSSTSGKIYRRTILLLAAALITVSVGYTFQRQQITREQATLRTLGNMASKQNDLEDLLRAQIDKLTAENTALRARIRPGHSESSATISSRQKLVHK